MAKKNNDKPTVTEATPQPPKFTVEQLRKNALELFGVTASTFEGAVYGFKGEFTVQEMKNHIEKWLKKEVK